MCISKYTIKTMYLKIKTSIIWNGVRKEYVVIYSEFFCSWVWAFGELIDDELPWPALGNWAHGESK